MSADNGIFMFNMPDGRYGVVEHTMSGMPYDIFKIVETGRTCYGESLAIVDDYQRALEKAHGMAREARRDCGILEYGVVDWTDTSYAELMAPYRDMSDCDAAPSP